MSLFLKQRKLFLSLLFSGGLFIILSLPVLADELGETNYFFVDPSYDSKERSVISATLRRVSDRAYFYIEDNYWQNLSFSQQNLYFDYLREVARNFDRITYLSVRSVFGSEWKSGIDNDDRITILLTHLKPIAGGYFNGKDERSKSQEPASNEREMFYISAPQINSPLIHSFLAHEFQHLINWNQKERIHGIAEEIWLNELRSEYAPTAAGYDSEYTNTNLERRVEDFLIRPSDSLTEWAGDRYDYPSVNLLSHYLTEQFGEVILSYMIENNKVGINSIEQALTDMRFNLNFSQVFNNWAIADYLNDTSLSNGQYGYKNPYLKGAIKVSPISYSIVSTSIINIAQNVKDWSPYWYAFVNKQDAGTIAKDLEIEFEGSIDRANFNVIYIVEYKTKPAVVGLLNLINQKAVLKIPDFKDDVESVIIIVSNQYKKSGFNSAEPLTPFVLSVATTVFKGPVSPPEPESPGENAQPEDYGLKEGDLIRAEGDFDIFIINQHGYKRLFLNPAIFEMYGHLGSWEDVKTVSPAVRDAFITSTHYRWADDSDGKVYHLEVFGEDTGTLHWINMTANNFLSQGGVNNAIFTINKSELDWYPKGPDLTSL